MAEDDSYFDDGIATFGDRIAAARDGAGLTQAELARRLGIKKDTLVAWENDMSEPRANRLQMLAGLVGVSILWLMTGQGDGPEPLEDVSGADLGGVLAELRAVRADHMRAGERLARLEKRLRGMIG